MFISISIRLRGAGKPSDPVNVISEVKPELNLDCKCGKHRSARALSFSTSQLDYIIYWISCISACGCDLNNS